MKKTLLILACMAVYATSQAQFAIKLGPSFNQPIGDMANKDKGNVGSGIGGHLALQYALSAKLRLGLEATFTTHNDAERANDGVNPTITQMPILATVEYAFAEEGLMPYVGAGVGLLSWTTKVDVMGTSTSKSGSGLAVAPIVGLRYGFNERVGLDLNVRYLMAFTKDENNPDKPSIDFTSVPVNLGLYISLGN